MLKNNIYGSLQCIVIFAYVYYRVGVVYESVCYAYACGLCDAVFEVDGSSESCLSEVAVGVCLMDSGGDELPMVVRTVAEAQRKMALDVAADGVLACNGVRYGVLPLLVFEKQTSGSEHKAAVAID